MTTSPDDPSEPEDAKAIDAAFDEIVANIDAPNSAASSSPWPDAENDADASTPPDSTSPPGALAGPPPQRTPRGDWAEWDDIRIPTPDPELPEDESDSDDEHYVPPPPPPLPKADRVTRWAWAGAIGAAALAIVLPLIGWGISGITGIGLVAAFLAGFGYLVSRMRTGPRVDNGPDDGAVV
ncbi:MAG: hypothetical protein ABI720_11535 [Actinomycetes bacterium]